MGVLLGVLPPIARSFDLFARNGFKAVVILLLTFGGYWLYCGLFLSKTRNIPGPLLNRFSSIPWARLWLTWRLSREVNDLHMKYGRASHFRNSDIRAYCPPFPESGLCFR